MSPGRYLENEWPEGTTITHFINLESPMENNEVRYRVSGQGGITVLVPGPSGAESLPSQNMPPYFSSYGASFSSYLREFFFYV